MIKRQKLSNQLFALLVIIISIIIVSLGIILPKNLLPIYEESVYSYLKHPLILVEDNINKKLDSEIAYIYVRSDSVAIVSENLKEVIKNVNTNDILKKITNDYGKFNLNYRTYYYNTSKTYDVTKIAITDDSYIKTVTSSLFKNILLVVITTYVIVTLLLLIWSNNLVNKIKRLKDKVDNIDNDNYKDDIHLKMDDELYTLDVAISNMHKYLEVQDEYKNQMYQNISHDFKTPITVIKSYIEAAEDNTVSKEKSFEVIKEQIDKLDNKVHSLLYLNKLNYIKDRQSSLNERCDVSLIINTSIEKFKMVRQDVKFTLEVDKKGSSFRGDTDKWEAIIDNILNNFVRYAQKDIKITIKNNKMIFYNDGPNIDTNILSNIFTPYEKGVNGIFGLGLSIVQKTLCLLNYDIYVENVSNGVKFIIK